MKTTKCPICGYDKFKDEHYAEDCYCYRCGYRIEQCYSEPVEGFDLPIRKGYKICDGVYIPKNWRKRKRVKRKYGIKYKNKDWTLKHI